MNTPNSSDILRPVSDISCTLSQFAKGHDIPKCQTQKHGVFADQYKHAIYQFARYTLA